MISGHGCTEVAIHCLFFSELIDWLLSEFLIDFVNYGFFRNGKEIFLKWILDILSGDWLSYGNIADTGSYKDINPDLFTSGLSS